MGELKKTRTRPWTSTGQVRLRARTSTGSARCRRLPEVELAPELELVRGLIVVLIAVKLECETALGAVVVAVLKFAIRTLVVGSLEQSTRRQAEMDIVTVTTVRSIVVVVVVSRSIMAMPRCR